jgi:hypothetical protein
MTDLHPATYLWMLCAIGFVCILLAGATYPPILAETHLDAVLSSEEWQDEELRESTRQTFLQAQGNQWVVWLVVGAMTSGLSLMAIRAVKRCAVRPRMASDNERQHLPGDARDGE